ncbi:TetR family transcriptional regulator [Brevibacterium yomogidense]|uniref:TetR family transcriptional regulator n=1 Tax=Brevibacterium yomogidense TaxID=946573 RepID=UPI0018E01B4E|nr:TetR family transcriptional regulator [Brevibacterium yomogidense]
MALTPDTVADAAMRILADFGLGDLTMRRLARDLGVQPSALYWHVADKQALFVLLAERMAAEADEALTRSSGHADTASVDALMTYRRVLLAYRESADIVMLAYAHSGPSVLPDSLSRLDEELRDVVAPFVLGSIAIQQTQSLFAEAGVTSSTGTEAEKGRTRHIAQTEGGPGADAETSFLTGLARLLAQ